MPLIKARDTEVLASQMPSQDRVESNATAIIERARHDASQIIAAGLEEARVTAQGIKEAARQEGYAAGYQEGHEKGQVEGQAQAHDEMREQLETLHASWSSLLENLQLTESKRLEEVARLSLRMSLCLSERIVHRQVKQDPSIVIEQIRRALELAQSPADLEIVVADSDQHRVHKALPGLLERFENTGYVSIRASEDMAPGGCLVQMRGGEVDASLEVQLQRLTEAILPGEHSSHLDDMAEGEAA